MYNGCYGRCRCNIFCALIRGLSAFQARDSVKRRHLDNSAQNTERCRVYAQSCRDSPPPLWLGGLLELREGNRGRSGLLPSAMLPATRNVVRVWRLRSFAGSNACAVIFVLVDYRDLSSGAVIKTELRLSMEPFQM